MTGGGYIQLQMLWVFDEYPSTTHVHTHRADSEIKKEVFFRLWLKVEAITQCWSTCLCGMYKALGSILVLRQQVNFLKSYAWRHIPVIPALGRHKQDEFRVILCYIDPLNTARLRKTLSLGVKIKNQGCSSVVECFPGMWKSWVQQSIAKKMAKECYI